MSDLHIKTEETIAQTEKEGSSAVPTAADKGKGPVDKATIEENANILIAKGGKSMALRAWEEAVEQFGEALENMREIYDEFDARMAPVLLNYGKALYELGFSQQGVMGKEEVEKNADAGKGKSEEEEDDGPVGKGFSFAEPTFEDADANDGEGEDGEDAGDEQEDEQEQKEVEGGGEQGEGAEEPEDDYNAAWEVLDVARTIYLKVIEENKGEMREENLRLAETYLALGDVSCETENFAQAAADYSSAVSIQTKLLAPSSRTLASTHYQLANALEFLPLKRSEALQHVQTALSGFKSLLSELKGETPTDNESVKKMSTKEKEGEIKDVEALIGDLEAKIEELKAAPEGGDVISQSIDHLMGAGGLEEAGFGGLAGASKDAGPVNDLTSMVRKKPVKKVQPQPVAGGSGGVSVEVKRKAEEENGREEKKAKAE